MSCSVEDRNKALLPMLPPCRVCGDKASGFHYGANTCEGCKVFFRRSLKRQTEYTCSAEKQCPVIAGSRNSCQHCRFRKCVRVGMSRSAIRHGRYTHTTRTRNILEVKRLEHIVKTTHKRSAGDPLELECPAIKREALSPPPMSEFELSVVCKQEFDDQVFRSSRRPRVPSSAARFSASLSAERKSLLEQCIDSMEWASETFGLPETSNCTLSSLDKMSPSVSPESASRCSFDSSTASFASSASSASSFSSDCPSPLCASPSMLEEAHSPEVFRQDLDDIVNELNPLLDDLPDSLMSHGLESTPIYLDSDFPLSVNDWSIFQGAGQVSDAQKWLNQAGHVMEGYVNFCKELHGFSHLSFADQAALIKGARSEVLLIHSQSLMNTFSGEMQSLETTPIKLEKVMERLEASQSANVTRLVKRLRDMTLTRAEQGLLVGIITTSTDRPDVHLQDRASAEKLYSMLMEALQVSITANHASKPRLFSNLIQLLTDLRTHSHYTRDLLKDLFAAEPSLQVSSILCDIFQS